MPRVVKCVTSSHFGVHTIALGVIAIQAKEGEALSVRKPEQLYDLLVRSRDQKTYRVRIEDGLVHWLDPAEMASEQDAASCEEAIMWDRIMNVKFSPNMLQEFNCNVQVIREDGSSEGIQQIGARQTVVFDFGWPVDD